MRIYISASGNIFFNNYQPVKGMGGTQIREKNELCHMKRKERGMKMKLWRYFTIDSWIEVKTEVLGEVPKQKSLLQSESSWKKKKKLSRTFIT